MRLKLLLLSLMLAGVSQAQALDDVTVALAIPPAVHDGAPYAAAQELGLFKQQNLSVKLVVFQGAGALLPQVASKRVTFGYPVSEPVISSYFSGKDPLPLRYFYNGTPAQTMEYTVLADSPIKTLADLKDKKIGVGALTWGTIPNSRAALRVAGLEPGKNVEFVAVGVLGSGFQALRSKQIDALNYNSSWGDIFELTGTKIRRIAYPDVFQETPGNGFIAHEDTFKDNPDLIRRFGRAYTEAQYVCEVNPEFCVQAFWRQYPESKPANADGKGLNDAKTLLTRRLQRTLYRENGSRRNPGEYDLPVIRAAIAAMAKTGEFPSAAVPVERIFSNEFVAAFDDFDKNALKARAEAAK
ncbi:ABC transporter substrate-binding protein [Affinibrenneria salicis]|uniref:ABC transporter substrate-binding protein n=1 Tax=Affinibrenneria salicis TaxID=2590031 RepID=A0A5J5G7C5_9GAMM|nr:ABC transporter substrate-binding protein [Affinibrenneria salicis]KAA9002721.1 ABC transporter substrate-binding protein [Affinibrenneria salicis]KAA9002992.1 ABC transporter substrate-binding protein [Affinibrenneria salicis]